MGLLKQIKTTGDIDTNVFGIYGFEWRRKIVFTMSQVTFVYHNIIADIIIRFKFLFKYLNVFRYVVYDLRALVKNPLCT